MLSLRCITHDHIPLLPLQRCRLSCNAVTCLTKSSRSEAKSFRSGWATATTCGTTCRCVLLTSSACQGVLCVCVCECAYVCGPQQRHVVPRAGVCCLLVLRARAYYVCVCECAYVCGPQQPHGVPRAGVCCLIVLHARAYYVPYNPSTGMLSHSSCLGI